MYTINVDWLNQNALRNYPILDGASRVSSGGLELANNLIVDLSMPVPVGSVEPGKLFVQRVYGFSAGVVITLASLSAPGTSLASATAFLDQHVANQSYPLVGTGLLSGATGRITLGSVEALANAALNLYDFSGVASNTLLVVSATRPLLRGLAGVVVVDSTGAASDTLTGTVRFQAGSNVSLGTSGNTLVISSGLQATSSSAQDCGCNDTQEPELPPIRSINGVFPDSEGNFTLSGFDCTEFKTVANGLQIVDRCTAPCCGCEQLTAVKDALQAVEDGYTGLQEAAEQIRSRIDTLAHALANASLNPPSSAESSKVQWWYLPVTPDTGFITGG